MIVKFLEYIDCNSLVLENETILLGVSGGADSVVMTQLFSQSEFNFGIAHCNFQLRADDANNDQAFVENLAAEQSIPFYSVKFDTKEYATQHGISIQMAARDLRFEWFHSICKQHGYSKIAIASNLNDSIETSIINITKGTGLKGLHGILPQQENIIHPLLFANKEQIYQYAKTHNIAFREDKSNDDTKYTRNKIRHNVIPVLKEINPSLENTFKEFFEKIQHYETLVNATLESFMETNVSQKNGEVSIDLTALQNSIGKEILLYEILNGYGYKGDQTKQIFASLKNQTGKLFYSKTHQLVTSSDKLRLRPIKQETFTSLLIEEKKSSITSPINLTFTQGVTQIEINSKVACLDLDKIEFPITLRKWEKGDRFKPLGLEGNKKLSDFFTDNKLSIFEKENIFVITSNSKIVWVVGYRIDDRFKVTNQTKNQLTIRFLD
jgi:tRNA(Ile)-lysidine synthase